MKQTRKYKNSKKINKSTKKIIFSAVIFIFIIIIMEITINYLEKRESNSNNGSNSYSSVQEILEKYGCTFIKEKEIKNSDYYKEIYLKFKYNTFEKNESKKRFYENVIVDLSKYIQKNYKLVDEEKNLVIEVKENKNSSGIKSYMYLINGKEDYFKTEESRLTLLNYEDDKNTNIEINSVILQQLVSKEWNKEGIEFGTKDSNFNKYDIYFDEGIEVRTISKKIYNIVFTLKHTSPVINGFIPGTSFEKVIAKLGEPTYGENNSELIGYKGNGIYVFFTKKPKHNMFFNI